MERLQRKLARMGRRARAVPGLEEALLTTRRFAYVRYRLRYLALRIPLRTVLHAMEVLLFARVVWPEFLPYFLLLRSGGAVLNGLLWGALEPLRTQVRAHMRRREPARARLTIERYLGASAWLQLALGVGLLAYLRWAPSPFSSFSILDAYGIALFARLGLDVLGRVYHAGIYAHRRVYRPFWSLLLSDLAEVALIALLLPGFGPWAFAPALLLGGLIKGGLALWFCRRTYDQVPQLRPRLVKALQPARLGRAQLAASGRFALANLGGQLDAWVVAVLSGAGGGPGIALAALLHVLRPALSAGTGWARLFYFDYKRLDRDVAGLLRRRFDRLLLQVAWAAGIAVALLLLAAATLVPPLRLPPELLPLLFAFVLARSFFGLRQLQAFVDDRLRTLLAQSACVAAGLLAVLGLAPGPAGSLALLAAALLAASAFRSPGPSPDLDRVAGAPLSLTGFCQALRAEGGSVWVVVADVDRRVASPFRVARVLSTWLSDRGAATLVGRTTLVWFEREPPRIPEALIQTAGALRGLRAGPPARGGDAALAQLASGGSLPPAYLAALTSSPATREARARALVLAHPHAIVLDHRGGQLPLPAGRPRRLVLRQVTRALRRAADGEQVTTTPDFTLHVLGPAGPIVAVPGAHPAG